MSEDFFLVSNFIFFLKFSKAVANSIMALKHDYAPKSCKIKNIMVFNSLDPINSHICLKYRKEYLSSSFPWFCSEISGVSSVSTMPKDLFYRERTDKKKSDDGSTTVDMEQKV